MSYCEWPQFYGESFPVARKEHRCIECQMPIAKGEKHLRYAGKWDGRVTGGRQHMVCRELCMHYRDHDPYGEGCIPFGCLFETWNEYPPKRNGPEWERKARSLMAKIKRIERAQPRFQPEREKGGS